MLPATTTVPAIIDQLITICHDATELQVTDGAHIGEIDDYALCVGIVLANQAGYTSEVSRTQTMGRVRLTEEFTVRCLLSLQSGDVPIKTLRDHAGDYLGRIQTALADHARVEETWDRVGMGGKVEWIPILGPDGASMSVLFVIEGACLL